MLLKCAVNYRERCENLKNSSGSKGHGRRWPIWSLVSRGTERTKIYEVKSDLLDVQKYIKLDSELTSKVGGKVSV